MTKRSSLGPNLDVIPEQINETNSAIGIKDTSEDNSDEVLIESGRPFVHTEIAIDTDRHKPEMSIENDEFRRKIQ